MANTDAVFLTGLLAEKGVTPGAYRELKKVNAAEARSSSRLDTAMTGFGGAGEVSGGYAAAGRYVGVAMGMGVLATRR